MDATQRARRRLAELEAAGLLRRSPRVEDRRGVAYVLDGRPVIGLCSNDYLGLADHLEVTSPRPAASGAGASRLICGDLADHRALEARLAHWLGAEDAVLFPSGFQLNVGVLPVLLEPGDRVESDALAHASLIDGMRLAPVRPIIVPHGRAPTRVPQEASAVHWVHWWITESVFSMDGDRLDLDAARDHLAHGGSLYVDEAHALGLFAGGQGWLGAHGVRPTVLVGTLSKALGCAGAFVAASAPLCALIRNRARSFVFSTGTSPAVVARIDRALEVVTSREGEDRRARLWANARHLAAALGLPDDPPSPIFPVMVGDNARALALAAALLERGWHVQAIRPPTVPPGTARLRLTVSAAHEREHLDGLARDLLALLERHELPLRVERGAPQRASTEPSTPASCSAASARLGLESPQRASTEPSTPPAPARRPA